MKRATLPLGAPVIAFLREPKERIWGLLLSLGPAGILIRGMDLAVFDEWVRQEARGGEMQIGPSTLFYPMGRVERLELDESTGPVEGCADRFAREVGRPVKRSVFPAAPRRKRR